MVALDSLRRSSSEMTVLPDNIEEEPQEEADAAEVTADEGEQVEEVDRDLTLEEQVDEIVLMLAEGKIGIHQFAALHGKAWTAVLHSRGQEDPAVVRQRAESIRRSSTGRSSPDLGMAITASGFVKKSRASRRSKELFREAASTGQLPVPA